MLTAIFGGTFNPLHNGHYEILMALENDSEIEKILLLPDRLPPHKTAEFLIDDEIRIEMCRRVCEDFTKCELCLVEFEREGKSYTYDTVCLLKEKYPSTNFAFVCGGDMLLYFPRWWRAKELMKLLPFIVFRRTATDGNSLDTFIEKLKDAGMEIILKDEEIPSVSSTAVRADLEKSKQLLPEKVYDFLFERGAYRD